MSGVNQVAERMLIGGALVESESGQWDESLNPATEAVIGRVPAGTAGDVDRAVDAAEAAWPAWAALPGTERGRVLHAFADAILERADDILRIEVLDTGNTITPMRADVAIAVHHLRYYAGLVHELKGETFPATPTNLHLTVREPYGVVGRIVPFNHPFMFAVGRTAAALAAGNAIVLKPPETSPLSAMILAEIAQQSLPAGLFNIVTGEGRTVGDAIVRHPAIKRLAFIGSTATGRAIQRSAAEIGVKHLSLELGGKNPMIVFPDNDVDRIADVAVAGMNYSWSGQSCGSTSRLLLHEDIHDAVVDRIAAKLNAMRVGDPMDLTVDMGPLNSRAQLDRVLDLAGSAKSQGARLLAGGCRPEGAAFEKGYWFLPTAFADVTPDMRLWREEVFGPVLAVARWRSVDEAVALANDSDYGLTAAIWTRDIGAALNTARRIRSGHLWINGCSAHYLGVPFGGMKNSGIGRDEGLEELLSYTEVKTINIIL